MFLKNCWYAAAWAHEVTADALLARKILGERVVFARLENDTVSALVDRCPHRHAPLSAGRIEGQNIRCMYHGLLFDAQGRCREVPGQDRIGANLKAGTFPVVERDKYVWIWMGEAALADPATIPDVHWQDDAAWRYLPGYTLFTGAGYELIMDNLLDFSHLGFVHENTLGGSRASGEVRAETETFDWGVRITRKYGNTPIPPYIRPFVKFEGLADRWQIYEWRVAGNLLTMNSGSAPAGTGALEGHIVPEACVLQSIQALTPQDERTTHYFWMQAHNFDLENGKIAEDLKRGLEAAFAEDRAMIQAQQKVIDDYPHAPFAGIAADAALNQGRAILRRMLEAEQAPRPARAFA